MKKSILLFSLIWVLANLSHAAIGAHPRIWLTSGMLSDMAAKQAAGDPDWIAIKSAADKLITLTVPQITILSASNSNPVVFTTKESLPWVGSVSTVYLAGGTGAWAGVNNQPATSAWTGTITGVHTFSIPVDSTAFGSFTGQALTFFMAGGEYTGYLSYGQTGSGWYDALLQLGILYKMTGTTSYATKGLELIDWINTLGAAGMISPVSQDSGRASMGATLGLAIGYDWFYELLTTQQKAATAVTLNLWNAWTHANAFAITDPQSNYWEAHVTASAASGYATYGDNANAQALIDWATTNWNTNFDPKFFNPPSTTAKATDDPSGYFYGGMAILGYNYGGNDISRHLKYMLMVKTATGTDMLATRDYGRRWAKNLIYSLKPDRWHVPPLGQWPGAWYGVITLSEALMLSYTLDGTTEGAWAQWVYQNLGAYPSGAATFVSPTQQDKFMFAKATRTSADYRQTEPPYYFSDGGEAQVFWRSDWTDNADYAFVNVSDSHYTGITPKHAGHIDLTRGSDYLLVASGHWKGNTGDGTTGSPENSTQVSSMESTLYFWDGGTTAGGRCFDQVNYDGCQLGFGIYKAPIQKLSKDYAFTENNFATSYDYWQVPASRTLQYFFRSFMALGDGTYVVWDRIQSTSATHTKQLRWHLSAASTPNLNGDTVDSTVGSSKIFIKTVLPASPAVSVVRNLTGATKQPINWHVEVTDPSPATNFNGLTVLYTAPSTGAMPATTALTTDANHVGVQIAGSASKVAIFARGASAVGDGTFNALTYTAATFTSNHAGTAKYLVSGLSPGTYSVTKDGTPVSGLTAVSVDATGVLYFTSVAGAFSVSTGSGITPPPASSLSLSCPAATSAQVGTAFSGTLLAGGGTSPYTFSLTGGSLPAGVMLNSASGQIAGTPSVSGAYSYTAAVADSAGHNASATCSLSVAAAPVVSGGGTYTCSGGTFNLANDIVLGNSDTVDLIGTPTARCTVTANNHRFIVSDASWKGHFKVNYADIFDAGTVALDILGGTNSGDYAYISGSGYIDIENSTFSRSSGFNIMSGASATVTFSYNTYNADNLLVAANSSNSTRMFFKEAGSSTATKYFQGNRIYGPYIDLGSPNWIVGAAQGCTSGCDAAGNILIGKRTGMAVRGSGSYVSYNYSHVTLDVTPDNPTWSQVYNLLTVGAGVIVENNIFRTGDWVANGIDGELRNNVLLELNPHNIVRIGNGGLVHHNILSSLYPGLDQYTSNARFSSGEAAFGLPQAGNNLSIYNNTLDARGSAVKTVLSVISGATVNSFRNNVIYRLSLLATNCPTGADCTSAMGGAPTEGFVSPPPSRALYMDYNGYSYDPGTLRQVTYDIGVAGKTICQPGWGAHDLGTCPNASVDPQFRGPLPIGSGQTGYGSTSDSGFPFNDADIIAGIYPMSALLSYYRWVYAPRAGSPLIGAQDPQDGVGDMGAVQTASLPAQAPSIVTVNKRPMVYAGPTLNITTLSSPAKLDGYAADDGLPSNTLTLQWTKVSGPGSVVFGDATRANTTAVFSANGVYTLRLTASDGALSSTSDATVNIANASTTTPNCDLNGDGVVDSKDVTLFINIALGLTPLTAGADLNGDGTVNVIDVMRAVIAAGGGGCKTTP